MVGRSPKSYKAEITRAKLIVAAASIIREEGPNKVTYREVARRAELSASLTSYYFASISDLLSEAGSYNISLWAERAERAAYATQQLSVAKCRAILIPSLIKACLPAEIEFSNNHYSHLLAAGYSKELSNAYHLGRARLDAAIKSILDHAKIRLSPELVMAVVDGAAVSAISEGMQVHELAEKLLSELVSTTLGLEDCETRHQNDH